MPVNKAIVALFTVALWSLLPTRLAAQTPLATPAAGPAAAALPQLGDTSTMTSADERRLGDRIAREIYRDPDYLDDPVLLNYVQEVWQPLLAAARVRGDLTPEIDERFAWKVLLNNERTVNAFALPGGYMGVNLGLLAVVSSRDELASVMGHELSHITQRHISRLMAKNNQQTPWVIGAMILGALAASNSPDAGNALMVGGQALGAQSQLNFSRDMEREADRIGFGVMTQAGVDPEGFVTMFDKLQQASQLNDNGGYPYLRSHPLTTERIADMQSRLPLGTPHVAEVIPTPLHAMIAARARVLSNAGADALQNWQRQVNDTGFAARRLDQRVATLYGAALAESHLHDTAVAQRDLQQLQSLLASGTQAAQVARWLGVEIALAARDLSAPLIQSMADSIKTAQTRPTPMATLLRPELMLQAQVALLLNQADLLDPTSQTLQSWLALHPQDALAWQWLASIETAGNQGLRALRAEAEAHAARLDYAGAQDRLRAAQQRIKASASASTSADDIEASIIDTRLRQIDVHENPGRRTGALLRHHFDRQHRATGLAAPGPVRL
ncbi:beta-barrel assembly-enhancing protease precursor [mine drainage metagenome]|uniref:Beta-barrel assembly-enhancing protease n=1 Tax=mine drainage metagenome TaxID=410659 RepID=A0A1J5Q3J5_9ZZZZ